MTYSLVSDPPRQPGERFEVLVHIKDLGDRHYLVNVKFPGSLRADVEQQYNNVTDALGFVRSMVETQQSRVYGARRT